jgi:allophanate hydrolase subunit 2
LGTQFGIPTSGAMDQFSYRWANHLLQNQNNALALEMAQPGLKIQFDQACKISLAGARVVVKVTRRRLQTLHSFQLQLLMFLKLEDFKAVAAYTYAFKADFR